MHANYVIQAGFVIEVKIWQSYVQLNTGHVSWRWKYLIGEYKLRMKFELLQPQNYLLHIKRYTLPKPESFCPIIYYYYHYYHYYVENYLLLLLYCIITIMLVRRYFIIYLCDDYLEAIRGESIREENIL